MFWKIFFGAPFPTARGVCSAGSEEAALLQAALGADLMSEVGSLNGDVAVWRSSWSKAIGLHGFTHNHVIGNLVN